MVILRAIGGFFVKIGRWIKKTAWIQPLLIVGGIFAVIFSIPYIVSAFQSIGSNSESDDVKFYRNFKVSLDNANKLNSDADQLFAYMENYSDSTPQDQKNRWGEKFFVIFVQEDCSGCKTNYRSLLDMTNDFGNSVFPKLDANDPNIKIYTIYIDTKNDIDGVSKNMFENYFFANHEDLFADASDALLTTPYCKYKGGDDSAYGKDVQSIGTIGDNDGFKSPTMLLFDPKSSDKINSKLHVTQALFIYDGKDGDSNGEKEKTLYDCWYGLGQFKEGYEKGN